MEEATAVALKAASHTIIVQPSLADNSEHQRRSGLIVASVLEGESHHKLYRGIILDIGAHLDEPNAEVGGVVHYSSYAEIGAGEEALHVVSTQYILAYE